MREASRAEAVFPLDLDLAHDFPDSAKRFLAVIGEVDARFLVERADSNGSAAVFECSIAGEAIRGC